MLSRLLTRKEQALLAFVGSAIVLGAGALLAEAHWRQNAADQHYRASEAPHIPPESTLLEAPPVHTQEPAISTPPAPEPPPTEVIVSIQGAVRKPGLYTLEQGERVDHLLKQAGGPLDAAELSDINLAARLHDATTLTIPYSLGHNDIPDDALALYPGQSSAQWNPPTYTISGSAGRTAAPGAAPEAPGGGDSAGGLIDLNTASQSDLESLNGIGPALAGRIIEYRKHTPFRAIEEVVNVSGIGAKKFEAIRSGITVQPTP